MTEFKKMHPIVNFLFFLFAIGFAMVFTHPLCLALSFLSAVFSRHFAVGKPKAKSVIYTAILFISASLITPLFSHEGVTILTYLPSGNPLTAESILYGISAAFMLITVLIWFSSFNTVMTSDKIVYLAGRLAPSLSLVFSMCLRFVPRFVSQIKKIALARKTYGKGSPQRLTERIKDALAVLSVAISISLEGSIETADSMKCRGYGLSHRTAYTNYRISSRDVFWIFWILCFSAYIIIGKILGQINFAYYPYIKSAPMNFYTASVFLSYFLLNAAPVIIEIKEAQRWKALKSKI